MFRPAAFALTAASVLAGPVLAEEPRICGQRQAIVSKLAEQFREQPSAVGVVSTNAIVEVFVSDKGSWTILATGTDGNSCVLSTGEGWQNSILLAGEGV